MDTKENAIHQPYIVSNLMNATRFKNLSYANKVWSRHNGREIEPEILDEETLQIILMMES